MSYYRRSCKHTNRQNVLKIFCSIYITKFLSSKWNSRRFSLMCFTSRQVTPVISHHRHHNQRGTYVLRAGEQPHMNGIKECWHWLKQQVKKESASEVRLPFFPEFFGKSQNPKILGFFPKMLGKIPKIPQNFGEKTVGFPTFPHFFVRDLVFFLSEVDAESPTELRQNKIERVWGRIQKTLVQNDTSACKIWLSQKVGNFPKFQPSPIWQNGIKNAIKWECNAGKWWNLRQK